MSDAELLREAYIQILEEGSIFEPIIQLVYDAQDFESAMALVVDTVTKSKIRPQNKTRMLRLDLPRIDNLPALQQYVTNSMFKQQGMGTGWS